MVWEILQAVIGSFLFAVFTALHDVPAVNNFTRYGSNKEEQRLFHLYNWLLKAVFVLLLTSAFGVWLGLTSFVIIWAVFNPVVAVFRESKRVWYYLSTGNYWDNKLLTYLGPKAGKWWFCICIALAILFTSLHIIL